VLKDRRVTKRACGIENAITYFHRVVQFETPHPEGWHTVVAHEESHLGATVVGGRVFHELTFLREMSNTRHVRC